MTRRRSEGQSAGSGQSPRAGSRSTKHNNKSARKPRGLTCANCRARKVRCEGGFPMCKTCEIYNEACRYDKTPSVSQFAAMSKRLQEAEQALLELRANGVSSPSSHGGISHDCEPLENDSASPLLDPPGTEGTGPVSPSGELGPTSRVHNALDAPNSGPPITISTMQQYSGDGGQAKDPTAMNQSTTKDPTTNDLSIDENGKIVYYGPTSAVHDPPFHIETPISIASTVGTSASSRVEKRIILAAHARESATWEEFAVGNASLETGIPRHLMAKLLHVYWTWVSPMFMWVYRPAFVRDRATGGRYYSDFLLVVICAHAAKYQDRNSVDLLLVRARRLLGAAIQQPSSIPTIQALLQLSARDLAQGSISQAWVYSGIAFRMASDLGLQHTGPDIKGMGTIDLEIRRRLFWSCYFWDKATSLYAGRLPAVTELLDVTTLDELDDSTEPEIWTPHYGDSLNLTKMTLNQYPPMPSHSVSAFANSCKLSIIINDIIVQLYSRRSRAITEEALRDIKSRLDAWRANSPSHLRYDPESLPAVCPPPHIISQNLLYFTTIILAHRPFWSVPTFYQVCIDAAQGIEKFILLLEMTFGLGNITYMMGYCIYTGASAILEDAKRGEGSSFDTLRTYLRALNAGMKNCPLLERSLHIIVKGLNHDPSQANPRVSRAPGQAEMNWPGASSYIPAFPYLGSSAPMDFDADAYLGGQDMDSFSMLDCFPELQTDFGDLRYPL